MADVNNPIDPKEGGESNPSTGSQGTAQKNDKMVPHQKFHEARERYKKAEEELQSMKDAQNAANEAKAKEQGEYKELLEKKEQELKELQEKYTSSHTLLESFQSKAEERVSKMLESIGESDKPLIESLLDGKTLAEKESLLPSLIEKFSTKTEVNKDAKTPSTKVVKGSEEIDAIKKQINDIKEKNGSPMELIRLQAELEFLQGQ